MEQGVGKPIHVRAVVYREGDGWIAQCLEYAICAQASKKEDLRRRLLATLRADFEHSQEHQGAPFKGIPPAHARFERLWSEPSSDCEAHEIVIEAHSTEIDLNMALARAA